MMKKMVVAALKVMTVALIFHATAWADDIIEPFGGLKWNDSLSDVVVKLNQIEGIEKIELTLGRVIVDLKGVSKKDDMIPKMNFLIEKNGFTKPDPDSFSWKDLMEEFIGIDGNKHYYLHKNLRLTASPVIIEGVPFNLRIALDSSPGIAVQKPDDTIVLSKMDISVPSMITEVYLTSSSPVLADKYKDIGKRAEEKYGNFPNTIGSGLNFKNEGGGDILDKQGRRFAIRASSNKYSISYLSHVYKEEMDEVYKAHVVKMESARLKIKNKGKKDMGSAL